MDDDTDKPKRRLSLKLKRNKRSRTTVSVASKQPKPFNPNIAGTVQHGKSICKTPSSKSLDSVGSEGETPTSTSTTKSSCSRKRRNLLQQPPVLSLLLGGPVENIVKVPCPACGRDVAKRHINRHLDKECTSILKEQKEKHEEVEHIALETTPAPIDWLEGPCVPLEDATKDTHSTQGVDGGGGEACSQEPAEAKDVICVEDETEAEDVMCVEDEACAAEHEDSFGDDDEQYAAEDLVSQDLYELCTPMTTTQPSQAQQNLERVCNRKPDPDISTSSNETQANEGLKTSTLNATLDTNNNEGESTDVIDDPFFVQDFQRAVQCVLVPCNEILFTEAELTLLRKLANGLECTEAYRLLLRLLNRKHAWLRVSKLSYPKIASNLKPAIDALRRANLLLSASELELSDMLQLLSVKELNTLHNNKLCLSSRSGTSAKSGGGQRKQDLIQRILQHSKKQATLCSGTTGSFLSRMVLQIVGDAVRVHDDLYDLIRRVEIIFFMVRWKGEHTIAKTLTMVGMGRLRYPKYHVDINTNIWPTRTALLDYQYCLEVEATMESLIGNPQGIVNEYNQAKEKITSILEATNLSSFLLREFSAPWVITRIKFLASGAYESLKNWEKSISLLRELLAQDLEPNRRGRWYRQLALHLDKHVDLPKEALELCKRGVDDPAVRTGHRLNLIQRAHRIARAKFPQLVNTLPPVGIMKPKTIQINANALEGDRDVGEGVKYRDGDTLCGVEELVLRHAERQGWSGVHCEGSFFKTLFGLLFWEILYLDLPGMFRTPYQLAPLDYGIPEFYSRRKTAIEAQLSIIGRNNLEDLIRPIYKQHEGESNGIVSWEKYDCDQLCTMAMCVGNKVVEGVCRILAQDLNQRSGGLPDLLIWKPDDGHNNDDGVFSEHRESYQRARFLEVKSPNDTLSEKQRIWLHVLTKLGADAVVCNVVHEGGRARDLLL
eukprot:m.70122 g.70122  ORF g.70122 m.70122 type:complete len:947 (+) comp12109_c0_seq1:351-3191(+)